MIVRGFKISELQHIGFWDQNLFRHDKDSSGYLFKTPKGERITVSFAEILKARKEEQKVSMQ